MKFFLYLKKYATAIAIVQATIWPMILLYQFSQINIDDPTYNPTKVEQQLMHGHEKLLNDNKVLLEVIRIYGRECN